MDKYIGKRLDGRYLVQEIIGIGGMANVYKATDLLEQKTVAVKILKDEFAENEEFIRRFKNESRAIALLSHPNIVKVFDVNFTDRINYIVMEHIDGITLKEYIQQQGVLTWKDAVHFTQQILRALQHAHDRGIIHRDIKPQNIMLLPDGSLKVMDFGIARFARSENRTITDKAIGSVHYISPEQARGDETDAKADLYSTGVILFEMLTGQLPFEADTAVSVAIKQISDKPVSPRSINADIPEGLEEITLKAMQKDVNLRYQSASEMLLDIEEFKKNPSISFQYKYFVDAEPTKYVNAIEDVREKQTQPPETGKKTSGAKPGKKKVNNMVVLGGVAAAFLVAALLLIIGMVLVNTGVFGGKKVSVPQVTGLTYTQAKEQYKDYTFKKEEAYSDKVEKGTIISQSPRAGTKIKKSQAITVKVSKGPEVVKIPDLSNVEASSAQRQLEKMDLVVSVTREKSDTVPLKYVIRLDPEAGTEVKKGSTVTLVVSDGAEKEEEPQDELVEVPNLIGLSESSARAALSAKGLTIGGVENVYTDSDADKGKVVSQNPSKGIRVAKGTVVSIQISEGKEPAASSSQSSSSASSSSSSSQSSSSSGSSADSGEEGE